MAGKRFLAHALAGAVVAAGMLTAVSTGTANACSCFPDDNEGKRYVRADHVFVGLVLSEHVDRGNPDTNHDDKYSYAVRVGKEYKGDVPRRVQVHTSAGGTTCGIRLTVGTRYLVFAHGDSSDRAVDTQLCSGTRPAAGGPPDTLPTHTSTTTPTTTPCPTAAA